MFLSVILAASLVLKEEILNNQYIFPGNFLYMQDFANNIKLSLILLGICIILVWYLTNRITKFEIKLDKQHEKEFYNQIATLEKWSKLYDIPIIDKNDINKIQTNSNDVEIKRKDFLKLIKICYIPKDK